MKTETTDQKIRLPVDVLEKLKEFAIQVSVHRKKQTTWSDLLRHAAKSIVTKSKPEGIAKAMEALAKLPIQDERPTTNASSTQDANAEKK